MKCRTFLLYGFLGVGAFSIGAGWLPKNPAAWIRARIARSSFEAEYSPSLDPFWSGPEILMVYVGQSHCAPSNASELPEMVEDIKSDLLRLAEESGGRFRALGLALDPSPIEGFHHLTKYGNFDEIRAGGGTLSDSAIEFIWEDFPGVAATPQVLVIGRVRVSPESPDAPVEYMLEREVEIVRMIGLDGIGSWSLDERLPRRVQLFLDQSSDGEGN